MQRADQAAIGQTQRVTFSRHFGTRADRACQFKGTRTVVLHAHFDLVNGFLFHTFFNLVTGPATAYCSQNRRCCLATATADLIAQHSTKDAPGDNAHAADRSCAHDRSS